jgi:transposase-like protein
MSNEIPVCPDCDSSQFRPRSGRHNGKPGWKCYDCETHHKRAAYRKRHKKGGYAKDDLVARLLEMDPEPIDYDR